MHSIDTKAFWEAESGDNCGSWNEHLCVQREEQRVYRCSNQLKPDDLVGFPCVTDIGAVPEDAS